MLITCKLWPCESDDCTVKIDYVITTEGLLLGDRNDTGLVHVLLSDQALMSKSYGCAADVMSDCVALSPSLPFC